MKCKLHWVTCKVNENFARDPMNVVYTSIGLSKCELHWVMGKVNDSVNLASVPI